MSEPSRDTCPTERILRVCAANFGRRRVDALTHRVATEGLDAFLPGNESDVVTIRAWLGWRELARGDESLAQRVRDIDALERHLLLAAIVPGVPVDRRLHWRLKASEDAPKDLPDEAVLDTPMAVVQGLRDALCGGHDDAMTVERARHCLARAAEALLGTTASATKAPDQPAAAAALARSSATILSGSPAE